MVNFNKRAQESLVSTKLITMILIILVILGLLMFLLKPDILNWLREAIPGYGVQPDNEINMSSLPADELARLGCVQKIALIGSKDLSYVPYVDLRDFSIYRNSTNSWEKMKLTIDVYKPLDKVLKIRKSIFQSDIVIGHVQNDLLTIRQDLIANYNTNSAPYTEVRGSVSMEDLKKLDGSKLFSLTLLCKSQ